MKGLKGIFASSLSIEMKGPFENHIFYEKVSSIKMIIIYLFMKGFEAIIQFSPYNLVMVKDTNIKIDLKCHSEFKMGVKAPTHQDYCDVTLQFARESSRRLPVNI